MSVYLYSCILYVNSKSYFTIGIFLIQKVKLVFGKNTPTILPMYNAFLI